MLKRSVWHVACPDRSALQEGSTGPLPEGACDSQPLRHGPGSVHASPCEDLQCDQPNTRAALSAPSVQGIHPGRYQWSPPPSNIVHSTLHHTTVSPVLQLQQCRFPDASRVQRGNHNTVRHVVVLAGYSVQRLHP